MIANNEDMEKRKICIASTIFELLIGDLLSLFLICNYSDHRRNIRPNWAFPKLTLTQI